MGDRAAEIEAALGLAWLSQYGCSPLLQLLRRFGAQSIWEASVEILTGWGVAPVSAERFVSRRHVFSADEALAQVHKSGLEFIPFSSPEYPQDLAELRYPPAGLFVKGRPERLDEVLRSPRVTIVGTRRSTGYGCRVADVMTLAFAERGVSVISGLALGIDGRAHRAALTSGAATVAVLGCGPDVIYPARHRQLYEQVSAIGIVASEYPPGTRPARWTFPQRNRILAALGDAVLVVEGSRTSGAMQTAEAALELGRPVFAVPGPITGESHQGCNWLLYDGAIPAIDPCATVEEFLLRTRIERQRRLPVDRHALSPGADGGSLRLTPMHDRVLETLASGPRSIDGVVSASGLSAREVMAAMAELEVQGMVARSAGWWCTRAP